MKPVLFTFLLFAALGVVALRVRAAMSSPSWGGKEKRGLKTLGILVVLMILILVAPSPTGWWAFFAFVATIFVIVGSVLMAVDFPSNNFGTLLEERTWGTDPNRPPPAFLLQAIAAGVLLVLITFFWVVTWFSALTPDVPPQADDTPSATAPASPTATPTPTPSATPQSTTPATVAPVREKCVSKDWLVKHETAQPSHLSNTSGVERCVGGYWEPWSGPAPGDIRVTASAQQSAYQLALFSWKGEEVMIRWIPVQ